MFPAEAVDNAVTAEKVSEMVKDMAEDKEKMTPAEQEHLAEMAKAMDPELTEAEAETVTEILMKVGPKADPETVEKVAEAVKESDEVNANLTKKMCGETQTILFQSLDESAVEEMAKIAVKLSHEMSDEEIEVVANMLEQIGDTLSNAEGQMIASIAETKGVVYKW